MTENTLLINNIIGFAALALVAVILITIPFRIKKNELYSFCIVSGSLKQGSMSLPVKMMMLPEKVLNQFSTQ